MFSLSKYVKEEIKNKPLFETYTYFNALSNEIKKVLYNNRYGMIKNLLGQNSEVKVLPYSDIDEAYRMYSNGELVAIILRYGAEDLYMTFPKGSYRNSDSTYILQDIKDMEEQFGTKMQLINPQSLSSYKKLCNSVALFLSRNLNKPKKNIVQRMSFQLIMADKEKQKIKDKRIQQNNQTASTVTVNNITTPSNSALTSYKNLQARLEKYVESKFLNYTDQSQLPTDINKLIDKKFQFKLLNNVFRLSSTPSIDIEDLLNKKIFPIIFANKNRYNQTGDALKVPYYIYFIFYFENNKFELYDIKASNDSWNRNTDFIKSLPSLSLFLARRKYRLDSGIDEDVNNDYEEAGQGQFDNALNIEKE